MDDVLELCETCKYACFISENSGYSPKECGLPFGSITYFEGCKKNLEPYYDDEQEAIECEGYEHVTREW